jgi:hypothetical protein
MDKDIGEVGVRFVLVECDDDHGLLVQRESRIFFNEKAAKKAFIELQKEHPKRRFFLLSELFVK